MSEYQQLEMKAAVTLHVLALGAGSEERTTVHDASEKEGRNENNSRSNGGW